MALYLTSANRTYCIKRQKTGLWYFLVVTGCYSHKRDDFVKVYIGAGTEATTEETSEAQ